MSLLPAVAMGGIIGLVHFFGEELDSYTSRYNFFFASFSAGFTLTYFFSVLLPETMYNTVFSVRNLPVLGGIALFYVIEEVLYEREENFGEIKYEFKEVHSVFIGLYHLTIGMMLYFLSSTAGDQLLLFFFPVLIHTMVNSLAIKEMHEEIVDSFPVKLLVSSLTLVGVFVAAGLKPSPQFIYSGLGVLGGCFIYLVVHDSMDPRKERPIGFLTGLFCFIMLLALIQ